ncbi:MAG: PEP-CTERM sorting domain-containing protein [Desmonostoc vinosum HA7617-LM4]|jgi:hypothetical protein|nr:PEP-CTERM sorting domain-containing protein [Desmonostoc vinosum HA7617-LM4]
MFTKLSLKQLSQATATTVLAIATLASVGTTRTSAAQLQTFKVSGTLGDIIYFPGSETSSLDSYVNGSFYGGYTVDVDQLPAMPGKSVPLKNWGIGIRSSSGEIVSGFSSEEVGFPYFAGGYVGSDSVEFSTSASPSSSQSLSLFVDSNFKGVSLGRPQSEFSGVELPAPIYGIFYANEYYITVTSFKSEPVPEPLTVGSTIVAGAIGLWLKRKKQEDSQTV